MSAVGVAVSPEEIATQAVDEIFADIRDRRFLKWLFSEEPTIVAHLLTTRAAGAIDHVEPLHSFDLGVQAEIREAWKAVIATALRAAEARGREEAAKYHDDEADRIRNQCQWHGRDTAYIEAIGAHEEAASAIRSLNAPQSPDARASEVQRLVDRFLAWKLPKSVRSDLCVTMDYPHQRSGTNLLTADEARQMIEHLFDAGGGDHG